MVKTLLGYVKEYKKDSILSPVFVTLEVIMEVIIPFLMESYYRKFNLNYKITHNSMILITFMLCYFSSFFKYTHIYIELQL